MKTLKALAMAAREVAAAARQVTSTVCACGQQRLETARERVPAAQAYAHGKTAAIGRVLREAARAADQYLASKTVCITNRIHDARCGFPQAPFCTQIEKADTSIEHR